MLLKFNIYKCIYYTYLTFQTYNNSETGMSALNI